MRKALARELKRVPLTVVTRALMRGQRRVQLME